METKSKTIEKVSKPEVAPAGKVEGTQQPGNAIPQSVYEISGVQRTAGNLAIQRKFRSGILQTKLIVGHPHDPLETEVNRWAKRDVEAGQSFADLERCLKYCHWSSPEERQIYTRYFLIYHAQARGDKPSDEEELDLQVLYYEELVLAHEQEVAREQEKAREKREAEELEQELKRLEDEEKAPYRRPVTPEELERRKLAPMVVDLRKYPLAEFNLALITGLDRVMRESAEFIVDFIPIVGVVKAVLEAIVGVRLFTGEKLSSSERVLNILFAAIPYAGKILRAGKAGARAIFQIARGSGRSSKEVLRLLKGLNTVSSKEISLIRRAAKVAAHGEKLATEEREALESALKALKEEETVSAKVAHEVEAPAMETETEAAVSTAQKSEAVAAKVAATVEAVLLRKGFKAEAIEALRAAGREVGLELAKGTRFYHQLLSAGGVVRSFINTFYKSPGFEKVILNWAQGGNSQIGARFVMKYCLGKLRGAPIHFEWPTGGLVSPGTWARYVDIVIEGGTKAHPGNAIAVELKSWLGRTLAKSSGKIKFQFIRDTAIYGPESIRWVFDASKVAEEEVLKTFINVITSDPYLTKIWGSTEEEIRKALSSMIEMYK
jgi:hypothetical protein